MGKAFEAGCEYGRTVGGILSPSCREERLQEHGIESTSKNRQAFMRGVLAGSNRKPMNARFWVWHSAGDCWVKLTLKPGQELSWWHGGATDEGYSHTVETWRYEDGEVIASTQTDSRDCDGPHSYSCTVSCPVEKLRERDMAAAYEGAEKQNAGIFAPEWTERSRWQRDHYAEAMGY